MPILRSYYQEVYRSPVVRLDGYSGRHGLEAGILAYLDFGGATGTSKDGLAETMLAFATERGTLQPGMPVVEVSSGSFGAALAGSCATTGHPCILVVPSNLPIARRKHLQDLGARIIACSSGGRRAMERIAEDTAKRYGGYYTHYFSNDDNPEYHRRVPGPQNLKHAGDAIDAVVIGVGSGGTITGVAEYIKAWNSMVRIVAVEPAESAAISGGFIGQHSIAGIGPGFVPENYNPYVVATVLPDTSADAARAAREVLFFAGVPACTSAGATLAAAVQLMGMGKAKRPLCVFAGRRTYEKIVKSAHAPRTALFRCGARVVYLKKKAVFCHEASALRSACPAAGRVCRRGGIRGCDLRTCTSCHRRNCRSSTDSRPRSRCVAGTGADRRGSAGL